MCPRPLMVSICAASLLVACASATSRAPVLPPAGVGALPEYAGAGAGDTAGAERAPAGAEQPAQAASLAVASRIGPNDQLEVAILEAPEMNRTVRVAQTGRISLPLLGEVTAAGRTPRELEVALETALRQRYIRDPHVSVQITEMQSHGIAVVGAVARPGVFQVREPCSLLDVIALAGGFAREAGDRVLVFRGGSTTAGLADGDGASVRAAVEIRLKDLLDSGDPRHNVMVQPGDLVKVRTAGLVYVVGEVRRPGAFPVERGTPLTVLQVVALGEGLGSRASKSRTMIIRTNDRGERVEIPVDLGDVLAGRAADPVVQARDVVFVPNSAVKTVTLGTIDALLRMVTLRAVF